MKPANHAFESKLLVSNGNFNKLDFLHWFKLSIALCKAKILGVLNLPLIRFITLITASELVILYRHTPVVSV